MPKLSMVDIIKTFYIIFAVNRSACPYAKLYLLSRSSVCACVCERGAGVNFTLPSLFTLIIKKE